MWFDIPELDGNIFKTVEMVPFFLKVRIIFDIKLNLLLGAIIYPINTIFLAILVLHTVQDL